MNKFAFAALLGAFILPLSAQAQASGPGAWVGYVTYAPQPVVATVGLQDNDLAWVADLARLIGNDGFTFLGRRDDDHWMGLTNRGASWLLQIRDTSARFNFRASIQPKTGRITVERGVDWAGAGRQTNVDRSTALAIGYLARARLAVDLFPETPPATGKPAMTTPSMDQQSVTAPPAMAPQAELLPDPRLGNGGAPLWQKLVDGNLRFVSGQVTHPDQSMARLEETAHDQHPFAIVVSCSDSRVPPEVLFDQGLGDLFVIRTAGEVVTEVELGSIEYAVEHLGVGYLVVLGHKRCDAVETTLKGGDLPPNVEAIAAQIRPAVEAARFFKGDLLDNAVRENTKTVLAKIQGTPALADAIREGRLNLKAAYYDIDTGKVAALP